MDRKLQIVSLLYGEAEDRSAFREVQDDDALRREHQAMSEVKFVLDHRPRRHPPPEVLEAVFAAADPDAVPAEAPTAPRARHEGRLPDRAPRPGRAALRRRSFGLAGALLAACLLLTIGVWGLDGLVEPAPEFAASQEMRDAVPPSEAEPTADAAAPPAVHPESRSAPAEQAQAAAPEAQDRRQATAGQASSKAEALPQWDAAPEVFALHREVALLEARAPDSLWDEPALPLEMLPPPSAGRAATGLHQARQPRY